MDEAGLSMTLPPSRDAGCATPMSISNLQGATTTESKSVSLPGWEHSSIKYLSIKVNVKLKWDSI